MNDFFNSARFFRFIRAHFAENKREYLGFILVAGAIDLIFLMLALSSKPNQMRIEFQYQGQIGWYTFGLFITALIFSARHFRDLAKPGSELINLMRPASIFEKCLFAFLTVGVLYPLVYTVFYTILNYPAVVLASHLYVKPVVCPTCNPMPAPDFNFYLPFISEFSRTKTADLAQYHQRLYFFSVFLLWSLQALIIGGMVFFKRSPYLWTFLSIFLLFLALGFISATPQIEAFWLPRNAGAVAYSSLETTLSLLRWLILPALLWSAVYFHIKEREVA